MKPAGGAGFAYLRGPDDALVEYQGNMPAERFNHVHMYQEQPFCAQLWYQTHLNVAGAAAPPPPAKLRRARLRTRELRASNAGPTRRCRRSTGTACTARRRYQTTIFGDVSLFCYMNQGRHAGRADARPPDGSLRAQRRRSRCVDRKLKAENVTFLEQPYTLGGLRAVMIEGPSREAIEIVEVK